MVFMLFLAISTRLYLEPFLAWSWFSVTNVAEQQRQKNENTDGTQTRTLWGKGKNGTHCFAGLGAAGIQAVGWARQREVTGFCTGPATILRL
jgi:hypothetical protein